MPHPGNKVHIPLPEREALKLLMQVKPTAGMPGQGASKSKGKKKTAKNRAK